METNVLDRAKELLNGDRAKAYGDVVENFKAIRDVANVMLRKKGVVLDLEDIAIVLVALKIAREGNAHSFDNLVDGAAYLNILNIMVEETNKKK